MRFPYEHIKLLQRRVDFLKSREHQNSYDLAEIGSLEWALANLPAKQKQLCRDDGRCQYAIDSGAEGMGHCPEGKCVMPAKQKPYGYLKLSNGKFYVKVEGVPNLDCNPDYLPLHTHPQPKREWVGLTDAEIDQGLLRTPYTITAEAWREGVRWAYHQLKEKNT